MRALRDAFHIENEISWSVSPGQRFRMQLSMHGLHDVWYKFLIFRSETNKSEKTKDNNKKQLEAFITVVQLVWD